ncbi:MAG: heme-binding domain-containing protein [Candidatus Krumholzibacteria bacterium]|nr:heme-binding domain-containing protein [Candidatus Krumholzibacteria bacterium]MDH4338598.1 heme-binding domain-containing protein [Candidatus Krumholzibacteria bacterium]MDH5271251.1 heme-binding domain-containing protein [Candidatus Krumholzibacteria bacterium]MDH5628503.1 heme-binding domain-containing protein [Candidatus Krumholzibacteria bacterium]
MVRKIVLGLVAVFVLIQLVPYGRNHANPPVTREPQWNSVETRATFERACGDCHSHATTWPWYSHVAPVSWLVQHDVDEARANFNVSTVVSHDEGHESAEEVLEGKMPPRIYLVAHPEARLSDAEKKAFAIGLDATFGRDRARGEESEGELGEKSGYLD